MGRKNLLVLAGAFSFATLISQTARAVSASALPDVSLLTPFAEFGNQENESLVTINGNVGVSSGGLLHVMAPSVIDGNVSVSSGASFQNDKGGNGNVHGSILTNQDLAAIAAQVSSASSAFSALTPDQTFSTVNSDQSFSAPAGTALVVDISNLNLNNDTITFSGPGYLVLNVTGSFSLGGSGGIINDDPTHVFVNYTGTSALQTKVGNTIDGYLLIPTAAATLDGTFFGGLYGGTGTIKLMSGAAITTPVPEPATTSLIVLASVIAGAVGAWRNRGRA